MTDQHILTLVNSRFTPDEAISILRGMVDAKLQHHARKIARPGTQEEDMKASETRMKQIEADLRQLVLSLSAAARRDSQVDIEGILFIREVPAKDR